MTSSLSPFRLGTAALLLLGLSCTNPEGGGTQNLPQAPHLQTKADSVAYSAYLAAGGPAWDQVSYIRFDHGAKRDGTTTIRRRHAWNRQTGEYRLERSVGVDSTLVVLFSTWTRDGNAFINGQPVDESERENLVQGAHRSHVNDFYWLAMPTKLFDEGVTRSFVSDSSTASTDVIHLAFEGVGYTPGDQYWLYVDRATGLVTRWTYQLEGRDTKSSYDWIDYREYATLAGPLVLSSEKKGANWSSIDVNIDFPSSMVQGMFSDPSPRL